MEADHKKSAEITFNVKRFVNVKRTKMLTANC